MARLDAPQSCLTDASALNACALRPHERRIASTLGCADGESGTAITQRLGTTVQTVSKWRRRYRAYRWRV